MNRFFGNFVIIGLVFVLCGYALKVYLNNKYLSKSSTINTVQQVADNEPFQEGDIIFQTSLSEQSKAIQLATKSPYSHCGILFKEDNELYVFEAIQRVQKTPLKKWIERGKERHYVVKRLKNAKELITEASLIKMKEISGKFEGKRYDLTFEWTDDKIYCSELIWKIYKQALGIEIGKLEKLKTFDLTNNVVKYKMQERYGGNIPKEEIMISPQAIFESELLESIH